MNTHIEKLSLDCGAWHQVYDQKRFMVDKNFDVEKFAELIVQECADVLLKWKGEPFPFDEDLAASLIKEHFGVNT